MSIVNMKAKCEEAKIMKDRTTELKSNLTTVSDRLNNLTRLVETLKNSNEDAMVKLDNKAESFVIHALADELETQKSMLNDLKDIMVTKDEFAANLDEISKCFESYIMNTPRIKSTDDNAMAKRIDELEVSLASLNKSNEELTYKLSAVDTVSRSVPAPEVPQLEINKVSIFKVPQKRTTTKTT